MHDAVSQEALSVYLNCMEEAKHRLAATECYSSGVTNQPRLDIECASLQLRKALELVAFAAIAPHKSKYEQWRAAATKPGDFRKDFNGREILASLKAINPYSYPRPLLAPVKTETGWHYEPFRGDYLTRKRYERVYDKCGALLHADNPWGNQKFYDEFRRNIPRFISLTRALLNIHTVIVQYEGGTSAFVVEFGDLTSKAKGHIGLADGALFVSEDYYR